MNQPRVVNTHNPGNVYAARVNFNRIPIPDCTIELLNNMGVTDSQEVKKAAYKFYDKYGFFQGDNEGHLRVLNKNKEYYKNKIQEYQTELDKTKSQIKEVKRIISRRGSI